MGDKEPIDVAMHDVERDPTTGLAKDLDDFAFDYDFYGYQDVVDDRTEHIESLKKDLETGNVEGLTDYLKEVIEEGDYMVPEATTLLERIEAIVPQQEVTKDAEKTQNEVKEQHELQETENYLKNAEMVMEDDYGMIDGIINNGEKAENPSVMAELKAAREARAERQSEHKEKHHDKKIDHDDR
jgi:putative CHC2 zinc finger protein